MTTSAITKQGQITIPSAIRKHLNLSKGDKIEFVILENGTVVVKPAYLNAQDLSGILKQYAPKKPLSVRQMGQAIDKYFRKKK